MSHEIIKNISINHKTKEVWITSCSNNVYPHTPKKWHCTGLTDYYKENGLAALEKEILYQFMAGNFQKGTSDYVKSIKVYGCPESGNKSVDYGCDRERAYANLLLYRAEKSVKVKLKLSRGFISSVTSRRARLCEYIENAKVFSLADANIIKNRFSNYEIEIVTLGGY